MPANSSTDTAFLYMPIIQRQQQGMVTLAMTLLVLFLSSLMVFQSSSGMLFEIKTGNNQVSHSKALEAARGGVEHALAWLVSGGVSSTALNDAANWSNGKANSTLLPANIASQSIASMPVTISLWQVASTASGSVLEVRASSSGDAMATVSRRVELVSSLKSTTSTETKTETKTVNLETVAPIVVHGDLGNCDKKKNCITGTPTISTNGNSQMVMTSAGSVVDTGFFNKHGPAVITGNFTSSSAWDYVFPGITMQQMSAAADYKTIYYYKYDVASGQFTPDISKLPKSIGTAQNPVILIFDTVLIPLNQEQNKCPSFSGNYTIFGIVYFSGNCTKNNGWGGTTITGSLVTESDLNVLTANTDFVGWTNKTGTSTISVPITTTTTTTTTSTTYSLSRKTASWRDF